MHPLPPQVQVDEITEEELKKNDGSDPKTLVISRDSRPPSSSPLTRSCPYDVFLSFRGVDTRNNFTGHLYNYLVQKGIKTFIDNEELRKGEEISSSLLKAIQGSKISILIFSENYASSGWCLNELVEILKCKELNQQLVWPVFYKVDPSDIRYQKGKYGEALAKHERRFKDNMDKVQRWRTALREAANFSGWTFSDGHEANFISEIAEDISSQVSKRSYLHVAKYPVGIESRVQGVLELLDAGGSGVRMVGIWGIGGLGKTTIAKAIYNSIRHKFKGCCFLANVSAASVPHQGLVGLQKDLLYQILGGREMKMTDVDRGIEEIKGRLSTKRILLVLDDVNELNQLDKLAGGLDWFGRGSRIIITTRDKGLLISHQVNAIYRAKALDNNEARNLLILNAFKENKNPDECEKFPIDTAVRFAHCLPLAINILGSLLVGKDINQWHDVLKSYKRYPNRGIHKVLETSYSALEDHLKEVFLDIACFLKGERKGYVMQALEDPHPAHALEVLEEKALINTETGRIWMHDLLEEMGKDIVHKESPIDAGRRSRVWFHEDVRHVLTENMGSNHVKGIRVELPGEDEICLSPKCFKKMKNLQLFININARFSGEVNYLSNQLRFLDWPGFPAQSLPSNFNPQKLVELNMRNSRISRLGEGLKNLQNLKSLSFSSCKFITEIPDLSGRFPNLESLNLSGCTNLAELHHSVGSLEKLLVFDLRYCCNLKTFPRMVNMKSLGIIEFSGCKRLEKFPVIVGRMEFLWSMDLSGTAIKEVPSSIGHQLYNLLMLHLNQCENLTTLPLSIFELQKLLILERNCFPKLAPTPCSNKVEYLEASNSNISHYGKQISSDPDQGNLAFPSLRSLDISDYGFLLTPGGRTLLTLDLSSRNFVSLPAGLAKLIQLERLTLNGCKNLQQVPELPNLKELEVSGCVSLERISKLSSILKRQESQMFRHLDFSDCWRLYGNLVEEAEKELPLLVNDKIDNHHHHHHEGKADLLSLFLSSQKSEFTIVFPASDEMPEWFSSRMGFTIEFPASDERPEWFSRRRGYRVPYEYDIEVLPNFKWENTGLALLLFSLAPWERNGFLKFEIRIRIDGVQVVTRDSVVTHSAWLQYIPFDRMDMRGFGYRRPVPPFRCRVSFHRDVYPGMDPLKSHGVHLVMPPNEECMKLNYKDSDVELGSSDANSELANRGEEGPSGLKGKSYDRRKSMLPC